MAEARHEHGNPPAHSFEKDYWEQHWNANHSSAGPEEGEPNPFLVSEASSLVPGTALDAGCGTGTEAIWLAARGWHVVAADISATALERAATRDVGASIAERLTWVEADLTTWEPDGRFDLVVTNYAHPSMPSVAFYKRLAHWVSPGGTLLIVGHLQEPEPTGSSHHPAEATVTLADITGILPLGLWQIDRAEERSRIVGESAAPLRDAVVRATRRS